METYVFLSLKEGFVPAGKLSFQDDPQNASATFAYGRRYLERKDAISLDPGLLPLGKQIFTTATGFPLFSAFRDSGPDRWGRYLLSKRFGRALNEFEYILAVGANRIGALAFGPDLSSPAILGPEGFEPYETKELDLALCVKATCDAVKETESAELRDLLKYGSSIGGARPKAAVTWMGKPYLAKFSTSLDTRNEPLIEYATMRLAGLVGIDIPEIHTEKILGRDVYLVERFDRSLENGNEKKIALLSGLTMMQLHESDYDAWSYGALCQAIKKYSDTMREDLHELFKRMVFNILVNNNDDHPRNHAFIHTSEDHWRLSRAYDLVPLDQRTQTFRLALIVGDSGKEASKENAFSRCDLFNLSRRAAQQIWAHIEEVVTHEWERIYLESGISEEQVDRFRNSIGTEYKI